MKAIFHKCYDDYGNLKDNALNIAYNLGKKEGLRKGKKIARAEVIDEFLKQFIELLLKGNVDIEDLRKLAEQLKGE